jgi:hypothetical protein
VSHLIRIGSTKSDRAIRFGHELDRAMKARGVGRRAVATVLHSSDTSVMYWRTGRMLPRAATAERLALVLDWPRLDTLARELRQKRCLVDDVEFVDDSGSDNRLYCSIACRAVAGKKVVGEDRRTRAAMAERGLLAHQRAVAAFCLRCEPSGYCSDATCELRAVSPMSLAPAVPALPVLRPSPHNGYRAPGQQSAMMSGIWSRLSPEEHAARVARAAAASRLARGLV